MRIREEHGFFPPLLSAQGDDWDFRFWPNEIVIFESWLPVVRCLGRDGTRMSWTLRGDHALVPDLVQVPIREGGEER